jgi:hypothetical protein
MSRYKVTFYQVAAIYDDAHHQTKRAAEEDAADFLRTFSSLPGHRREGSIRRNGYAAIVDYRGGTEAMAEVHKISE